MFGLPWLSPTALIAGCLFVAVAGGLLVWRRHVVGAARLLIYALGAMMFAVLGSDPALFPLMAMPFVALLVSGTVVLPIRESLLLTFAIQVATFAIGVWGIEPVDGVAAYPVPLEWLSFALTSALTVSALCLLRQSTNDARRRALAANATRRQADARARRASVELRQLTDRLPLPVCLLDPNGKVLHVNQACLTLLGKGNADINDQTDVFALWPRGSAESVASHHVKASRGRTSTYVLPFTTPEGVQYEFEAWTSPARRVGAQRHETMTMLVDQTGRRLAERALGEHEAMYRAVVEYAPLGILTQEGGVVTYANPAALLQLGAGNDMSLLMGMSFYDFISSEQRQHARDRVAPLESVSGFSEFHPYRLERPDGVIRDVELASVSIPRNGRLLTQLFCVDVTERERAQEIVRKLNETLELRVAERTSELEAFTSSVSHDLRAPIRQVISATDILLRRLSSQADYDPLPMLGALGATAKRMNQTIEALLELSRLGRAGIAATTFALEPLMNEVIAEVSAERREVDVDWTLGALPEVYADPQLIRMVLVNLIDNAVKFSRYRHPARVQVWADSSPDMVTISVRDNGAGFDMQKVDKLFDMFSRLHSSTQFEGTGVGLAHCRRIIERHGGRITADGRPEGGATFRFSLPREGAAASALAHLHA
jgi:PAS domain S-box-containing protein